MGATSVTGTGNGGAENYNSRQLNSSIVQTQSDLSDVQEDVNSLIPNSSLLTDLVAFYPIQGFKDTSGNGNYLSTGFYPTDWKINPTKFGWGLADGNSPDFEGFLSGGAWSASFWAFQYSSDYVGLIFANTAWDTELGVTLINISSNTVVETSKDSNPITQSGSIAQSSRSWIHVAISVDATGAFDLYLNGTLLETNTFDLEDVTIASFYARDNSGQIASTICLVGFWDREITSDEVEMLYNDGNGFDPTA